MEILKSILLNTNPGIAALIALLMGVLIVLSMTGAVRETDESTALELFLVWLRRALVILLLLSIPLGCIALYVFAYIAFDYDINLANNYMSLWLSELSEAVSGLWWSLLVVLFAPVIIKTFMLRWLRPSFSAWKRKFRIKQGGDSLSDIRVEISQTKPKNYDPRDYYMDGKVFLGLEEDETPIYMDDDKFLKSHKKIIGPSQTGKGVLLGILLDQAIKKGWGAWFYDIKPDDFIYDIVRESCERHGRPSPIVVDLNGYGEGSYAPFANGTIRERRERVVKAFSLADTGETADFYRRNEREVLDYLMPYWDGSLAGLAKLIKGNHPEITDQKRQWIHLNCGSIRSNISEFMQLETLCAPLSESINVAEALERGEVVFIRSHMKDTIVRKATIALLDEVIQVALRKPLETPVFMGIDECRFVVSDTLADALATLLSKGINMALAYQTIKDLMNLPDKTLNAESIRGGIEANTLVTFSYKANDHETAEWVSLQTGSAIKNVTKLEKVEVNQGGAEMWGNERSVGQTPEQLITENKLLALPERVSALLRPGKLATLAYTCWIPLKEVKSLPPKVKKVASAMLKNVEHRHISEDSTIFEPDTVDNSQPSTSQEEVADNQASMFEVFERADNPELAKPKKKLSEAQEEAINAAFNEIVSSSQSHKKQPDQPLESDDTKKRVDLSQLDDLDGI